MLNVDLYLVDESLVSALGFFVAGSVSSASENLAALLAFFSASGLVNAIGVDVVAAVAAVVLVVSKVEGVRGVADGTGSVTF